MPFILLTLLNLIAVLSPADDEHHIDKRGPKFNVPFVCGARNLGEALRRISEGAAMIRTKGEAGTGKLCKCYAKMSIFYTKYEEQV